MPDRQATLTGIAQQVDMTYLDDFLRVPHRGQNVGSSSEPHLSQAWPYSLKSTPPSFSTGSRWIQNITLPFMEVHALPHFWNGQNFNLFEPLTKYCVRTSCHSKVTVTVLGIRCKSFSLKQVSDVHVTKHIGNLMINSWTQITGKKQNNQNRTISRIKPQLDYNAKFPPLFSRI